MSNTMKKFSQWALFYALCFTGTIAFIVLAMEENPMNPIPFCTLLIIKVLAMIIFIICVFVGKKLHKRGYLPEYTNTTAKDE